MSELGPKMKLKLCAILIREVAHAARTGGSQELINSVNPSEMLYDLWSEGYLQEITGIDGAMDKMFSQFYCFHYLIGYDVAHVVQDNHEVAPIFEIKPGIMSQSCWIPLPAVLEVYNADELKTVEDFLQSHKQEAAHLKAAACEFLACIVEASKKGKPKTKGKDEFIIWMQQNMHKYESITAACREYAQGDRRLGERFRNKWGNFNRRPK